MAIRLCHSCAREVNEGDRVCRYCNAVLDQHQSIIEVGGDDEGFSLGSNKNAYEDETLKNFKQEQIDARFEGTKSKSSIQQSKKDEVLDDNTDEDFDDNPNVENMYNGIVDIIKNPKDYVALFVGILSCALFIAGIILPVYYGIEKKVHYIYQKDMYYFGFFVMFLIIVSFVLIIRAKQKYVIVPAIFSITLLIYLLLLFASIEGFSKLGLGYYILWFASIIMITSAVLLGKDENEQKRRIKRGDYRNEPLHKRDFIWMLITVIISMLLVGKLIDESKVSASTKGNTSTQEITNETAVKIVVDDGNVELNIIDTYMLEDDGKDVAVVKVTLNNNRAQAVSFDEVFTITVHQDSRQLTETEDINTEFDLTSSDLLVAAGSSQDIYFGYILENKDVLEVTVYRNSNNKVLFDNSMGFNEEFYTPEATPTDAGMVSGQTAKAASTKKANNTAKGTETPAQDKKDNEQDKPTTQTKAPDSAATTAPTAAPTQQPTPTPQPTSWDIYFNKPASWGDKVYIYMYIRDDSSGELKKENNGWPGVEMNKSSDNMYKYTYNSEWYKVGRCLFSDGNGNQYPVYSEEKATGVWMTGSLNVSVPTE